MSRAKLVSIDGKKYTIESDDDYVESIGDNFEPHMVELFKSVITTRNPVLDIGANIGCTALLFASLAEKVYAFEPSPTTFEYLRKNSLQASNVEPVNIGLGRQAGTSTLTFAPNNRSGGFISNQMKASAGHTVETIEIKRLDDFIKPLNLNALGFVKIDVEGFEPDVLKGGIWTLRQYAPIVVLELNHWCLNAFQRTSVPDFFDLLRLIFPGVLAVDLDCYLDIVNGRFPNILCYFHEDQVNVFKSKFRHGH